MQVVRDQFGLHREQPLEVRDAVGEGAQGLVVAQVADVVRDPRAAVAGERERVLELGADREQRRRRRDRERRGDEPARAPHDPPAAHDGVVDPRVDRPVVQEEQVRDPAQPLQRVVVRERDRLVGHVAARHHQRHADVGQQQVVQRRVGEHHAEVVRARRDRRRDARVGAARRDHDRRARRAGRSSASTSARGIARHQRERAVLAVLAGAQAGDGGLVVGAAREVEPADALDRDDPARRAGRRPPRRSRVTRGPHAGQAFGWAWKRRSRGSSYSAGTPRTSRSRPSSSTAGRTAPPRRS